MTFAGLYARTYDAVYAEKDYAGEVGRVVELARRHGVEAGSALDLGCGTGGHAVQLAERGWTVTGVDRSAPMLEAARRKLEGTQVELVEADIRTLELEARFDLVLLAFAVLGYQYANRDVRAVLETAARHLRPGGLLAFDVWYGPAVLGEGPGERLRTVPVEGGTLYRFASAELDPLRHVVDVRYQLVLARAGEPAVVETETHGQRYFFPLELELFLDLAGFDLLQLGAFEEPDRAPGASDWNVLVVARRR